MKNLAIIIFLTLNLNVMLVEAQEITTKKIAIDNKVAGLVLSSLGSVEISYGTENQVDIIGKEEVINRVKIQDVDGKTLAITGFTQKGEKGEDVKIIIKCTSIQEITANSIGKLKLENAFNKMNAKFVANSIGSLIYKNNNEASEIEIEAVGNLFMSGSSKTGHLKLTSVARIEMEEFKLNETKLTIFKSDN